MSKAILNLFCILLLNFSCLNIRSASSISTHLDKPAVLQEFLSDHSIDILALTETWLTPETLPSTLNSLTPPGYSIIHSPRLQGKGSGLGLIFRSFLKVSTVSLPLFSSFESLCVRLTTASTSFTLLVIYRPPCSNFTLFQAEFSTLLEDLISSPSELMISTFTLMIPTLPLVLPSFPYLIPSVFLNLSLSLPSAHTAG